MFTIPNDIAPGGVSGLSTALAYITPIRVSIWNLMLNACQLPLCAWKSLGPRSLAMTLIATPAAVRVHRPDGVLRPCTPATPCSPRYSAAR